MTEDVQIRQHVLVTILIRRIRTLHVTHDFLPTLQPTRTHRHGKLLRRPLPPFETVQALANPSFNLLLHAFPVDNAPQKTKCLLRAAVCTKQTRVSLHEAEPLPGLIHTRLTPRYHRHPQVFPSLHGYQTFEYTIISKPMIVPGTLDMSGQARIAPLILIPRHSKASRNIQNTFTNFSPGFLSGSLTILLSCREPMLNRLLFFQDLRLTGEAVFALHRGVLHFLLNPRREAL